METVLNVLGSVLANLCQKDWDNRDDDDIIIIERILLLIRNILHVSPDPQEEKVINMSHNFVHWKFFSAED